MITPKLHTIVRNATTVTLCSWAPHQEASGVLWPVTGDAYFDHLVMISARVPYYKVTIFPFVINMYLVGDYLKL